MSRKKDKPSIIKTVRCAIYTRKSTEEGLEQEFNTLDAQREAGEAYIKSQQHEGWICVPSQYDDGGYTGANMDRPAMRRLLADIDAGKIDCVVVYKVDRLSRSLLDFARIMETFDRQNVSFVSVTQAFNTASSMGRLILNVLLSFAQFEREMISERTRESAKALRAVPDPLFTAAARSRRSRVTVAALRLSLRSGFAGFSKMVSPSALMTCDTTRGCHSVPPLTRAA